MNKSKHAFESLLVLLIVILSIPAVSESNNIVPQASSLPLLSTISLNPTSGPAGTTVTVTGSLFLPDSVVSISYDATTVTTSPGTIITNLTGIFSYTSLFPSSKARLHTLIVILSMSNSSETNNTVTPPSPPPPPSSISLNPTSGPAGTTVTVTG